MKSILFVVLLLLAAISCYEVSYSGYQVLRCHAKDQETFDRVIQFTSDNLVDLWDAKAYEGRLDINLSPSQKALFLEMFSNVQTLSCENFIEDVQARIDQELEEMTAASAKNPGLDPFFDTYRSYSEIVAWMNQMAAKYSFMYVVKIGESTLKTDIFGIRMNGGEGRQKRQGLMPTIYYQGGQHAREWIGPVTVCYILNMLAENYEKNGTITKLVDSIHWILIPSVNPDGYTYSRSSDRLWRKNRRPPPTGFTCPGVDTNRNFNAYWNNGGGSSTNPCSETYHGIAQSSEVEVQNIVNFFAYNVSNVQIATDWHSYGQYYLIPWGWTTTNPANYTEQINMGNGVAAAIRAVNNRIYTVGSTSRVLYIATGSFTDWAFLVHKVPYSQTIELRDTGTYGFILPASEIVPTGNENFNGVVHIANRII